MTDNGRDPVSLLWADDDSLDALEALTEDLEDANFQLERAVDFLGAVKRLEDGGVQALLLDVILPHARGSGSLAYDLGMTLAELAAAKFGVKSVVFLTVVRKSEVADRYNRLGSDHAGVEFAYFDKTQLFEKHVMENIFNCLRARKAGSRGGRDDA